MKKIFLLLNIFALCLLASCNPNEYAKFNDKDAFVAFGSSTYSVSEDGGSIKIPVTLASVAGLEATVTVSGVDVTAKSGVNYTVKNGGKLLFNSETRTAEVEVEIVNVPGVYTGDIQFNLTFSDLGGVNAGKANTATVTILDLDHPLSYILGTYDVTYYNTTGGPLQTNIVVKKDDSDISKVWVRNLFCNTGWDIEQTKMYGIVDTEANTITFPIWQMVEYKYSGIDVYLVGMDWDGNYYDAGNLVVYIEDGGKTLKFNDEVGPCIYIDGMGFGARTFPGAVGVKVGE